MTQFERDATVILVTLFIIGLVCYLDHVVTKKHRDRRK